MKIMKMFESPSRRSKASFVLYPTPFAGYYFNERGEFLFAYLDSEVLLGHFGGMFQNLNLQLFGILGGEPHSYGIIKDINQKIADSMGNCQRSVIVDYFCRRSETLGNSDVFEMKNWVTSNYDFGVEETEEEILYRKIAQNMGYSSVRFYDWIEKLGVSPGIVQRSVGYPYEIYNLLELPSCVEVSMQEVLLSKVSQRALTAGCKLVEQFFPNLKNMIAKCPEFDYKPYMMLPQKFVSRMNSVKSLNKLKNEVDPEMLELGYLAFWLCAFLTCIGISVSKMDGLVKLTNAVFSGEKVSIIDEERIIELTRVFKEKR